MAASNGRFLLASKFAFTLIAMATSVVFASPSFAQAPAAADFPAHAHPDQSANGKGWNCDWGYRREAKTCIPVTVPANAFLIDNLSGSSWQCERGYRKKGEECVLPKIPDNAHYGRQRSARLGNATMGSARTATHALLSSSRQTPTFQTGAMAADGSASAVFDLPMAAAPHS